MSIRAVRYGVCRLGTRVWWLNYHLRGIPGIAAAGFAGFISGAASILWLGTAWWSVLLAVTTALSVMAAPFCRPASQRWFPAKRQLQRHYREGRSRA